MADKQLTELTALAVAPAATDVLYIGDLSEAVDDDKNKQITVADLFKFVNTGDGIDVIVGAGKTLNVSAGTLTLADNQISGDKVSGGTIDSVTLSTPTINDLTNATHDHSDSAGGGSLASGISIDTPTIADFTNAAHDHSSDAEGGEITRTISFEVVAATVAVATGDNQYVVTAPTTIDGMTLTNVIAAVYDKGVTGTTDVMVHRRRGGTDNDMLSVAVTIGDEWFASDETIDTSYDDVQTGDLLCIDVDAIHSGTAPNGLFVTLEFAAGVT